MFSDPSSLVIRRGGSKVVAGGVGAVFDTGKLIVIEFYQLMVDGESLEMILSKGE